MLCAWDTPPVTLYINLCQLRDPSPCRGVRMGWEAVQENPELGPLYLLPPAPFGPLTRIVVTTRVLLARVCDRLMSRVVAFMARVRLEYHTPIWGQTGCHQHRACSYSWKPQRPNPSRALASPWACSPHGGPGGTSPGCAVCSWSSALCC